MILDKQNNYVVQFVSDYWNSIVRIKQEGFDIDANVISMLASVDDIRILVKRVLIFVRTYINTTKELKNEEGR